MVCVQCGQKEATEHVKGFKSRVCTDCKEKFTKYEKKDEKSVDKEK